MFLELDRHNPDSVAVIDADGNIVTYGQLCQDIKDSSNFLVNRAIVFLLCENSVGAIYAYLSCIENKCIPLILSSKIDEKLLSELIATYKPAYIWSSSAYGLISDDNCLITKYGYKLIRTEYSIYPVYEDLALLLSTSGSTGSPKLVRHNYKNLISSAKNVAKFFDLKNNDRPLIDLPMFYTMGHSVVISHLYAGATLLMISKSMLDKSFWDFFVKNEATSFTGVPYSYQILKRLGFTSKRWPSLKLLTQGGGKLSNQLYKEFSDYAYENNIKFIPTFGQTECTARMAYLSDDLSREKIGSIGNAIPEGRFFLVDDSGKEIVENDIEGELGYAGPNVALGYAEKMDDLSKGDEWKGSILTGDIAIRDSDDCYYIVGRKKRFLKLFGCRVSLDRCEKLIKDEFNLECVCMGNDEKMLIYVEDFCLDNEIPKFLSKKMGMVITAFKVIHLESFPRNEYGKIKYIDLQVKE